MTLTQLEIELFYKIWYALIWHINEAHDIVPDFERPNYGTPVDEKKAFAIRNEMWENLSWIDDFLKGPAQTELTSDEREIVENWRNNHLKGRFFIFRHLAKYSIFIPDNNEKIYGVCGISNTFKDMFAHRSIPIMVETVLIPFKDKIIYDSFLAPLNIFFGSGIKGGLNDTYRELKASEGIWTRLDKSPVVPKKSSTKNKPKAKVPTNPKAKEVNVPSAMYERYEQIAPLIKQFCQEHLDVIYEELCLKALQKLCRKRPSPIATGRIHTWACGIVYAIGRINFIFDRSQLFNLTAEELAAGFGIAKSTAGNKATEVEKLLKLSRSDWEFLRPEILDGNPAVWYLSVNGYFVDIRKMPRDVQEEAFRKGLIPYIPDDQ